MNGKIIGPCLQFRLLQSNPEELREIYEVEEGLENRLIAAALTSDQVFKNLWKNSKQNDIHGQGFKEFVCIS